MTPLYMRGRSTYEDELEDAIIRKKPYYFQNITRGQSRGMTGWFKKKVVNTEETTGIFKCIPLVETPDHDPKELYNQYKSFLTSTDLVCRLYILKAKSLTPMDNRTSDPYLMIECGSFKIDDSKNAIQGTNNPGFYKHFDIPVTIPGASTLKIKIYDEDGFKRDDLIGKTSIDLEERYFSSEWQKYNSTPGKKIPIEERTIKLKTSAAPQGVIECWVELMDPKEAKVRPVVDIKPFEIKEFEVSLS